MLKTIRQDLSVRIGLVILCISIIVGSVYYFFSVNNHKKEFEKSIKYQTNQISDTFSLQLWLFDLNTARELCKVIVESPEVAGLRLFDQNKQMICEQNSSPEHETTLISKELRYEEKTLVGYIDIYFADTTWKQQKDSALSMGALMAIGTILGSMLFINILLKRFLSKPLEDLQKNMNLLARGDFEQSKLSGEKAEIQNIIDTFNKLTIDLKERDKEIASKTDALKAEISERKHTEKLLRTSQEQWEKTFNAMDDIVTIQTTEMQIIQANKSAYEFFQMKEEELLGKHCYELFSESDTPCPECPQHETVESLKTVTGLVEHPKSRKSFFVTSSPVINENGKLECLVHTAKDVTRQKELEEELLQAHKMEAIGTLAGGIAHDFNNILGVILGYTDMAKEDAPPGSKFASNLDKVILAGNRAKDLVKQILAFSRQTDIERIPLQLQSLIKEAVKMLRASIPSTIEIQERIDSNCGHILADPTQVHQILMNLCANANHAMEKSGGTLKIELQRVDIGNDSSEGNASLEPGQYVELIVSDTGVGITPSVIDKIFDPYFTTKEPGKGTGMGLSIIHGIVNGYGGTITVESEIGQGTTFHVYFPAVEKNDLTTNADDDEVPRGKGKILFIDDEELLAQMGKDMLERLGYQVTVRQNSIEALATFQNSPSEFDAVITDQTMPGMTGADLSRRMLQTRPDIPIILCTGYSYLIDEGTAKSLGIREFALKPLTKATLSQLLQKVLNVSNS